jgi:threonine/homoserine/homoserine lactone efflux protein
MHWSRILGIALLVGGAFLLYMGWSATESLTEDIHESLTGRYSEDTRNYLIGGGVAAVIGFVLLIFGVRR